MSESVMETKLERTLTPAQVWALALGSIVGWFYLATVSYRNPAPSPH